MAKDNEAKLNDHPKRVSPETQKKQIAQSARTREVEDMWWSSNKGAKAANVKADDGASLPVDVSAKSVKAVKEPVCHLESSGEDSEAPLPVVLITLGRSGSSSIWQVMGNLTGQVTPIEELTGSSSTQSTEFFSKLDPNDDGNWALDYMCEKQEVFPQAGMVGFKWKPFGDSFFSEPSVAALKKIAKSANPQIKVVRSKRNLLDRAISVYKHRSRDGAPAHCSVGDVDCIEKHKKAMLGLEVPVDKLVDQLTTEHNEEERVDQLLLDLGVPHVKVSFEKLYYGEGIAQEWMNIFEFLGVGPSDDLRVGTVEAVMEHAVIGNPFHNQTLANYEEVQSALMGTQFERLLH
jgi:hypothetical protein